MFDRNEDLARAIRARDTGSVTRLMFIGTDQPSVRPGFRTETDLWDFKADCPKLARDSSNAWATLAADVLGFHNNRGGVLIFGIRDDDFTFCGASTPLDGKRLNDQLHKYLEDTIWVEYHREFIQPDQRYLGIAIVQARGPRLERFTSEAPQVNGRRAFALGGSAMREEDSTRILSRVEADEAARQMSMPLVGEVYAVDEPFYRILAPEYIHFVARSKPCGQVESALANPRVSIASIIGIGGIGKTALATWAVLRSYERKHFDFIVSITAKDRELTASGIRALDPTLTNFESLLDSILDVTGFPDHKTLPISRKEEAVRALLSASKGLLFVDNLETVDDKRIIEFLDTLPPGVRAITTSRRSNVRVSVQPIDLGPLEDAEMIAFAKSLSTSPGGDYVAELSDDDCLRIGKASDRIPLVIRWVLSRSQ